MKKGKPRLAAAMLLILIILLGWACIEWSSRSDLISEEEACSWEALTGLTDVEIIDVDETPSLRTVLLSGERNDSC